MFAFFDIDGIKHYFDTKEEMLDGWHEYINYYANLSGKSFEEEEREQLPFTSFWIEYSKEEIENYF